AARGQSGYQRLRHRSRDSAVSRLRKAALYIYLGERKSQEYRECFKSFSLSQAHVIAPSYSEDDGVSQIATYFGRQFTSLGCEGQLIFAKLTTLTKKSFRPS